MLDGSGDDEDGFSDGRPTKQLYIVVIDDPPEKKHQKQKTTGASPPTSRWQAGTAAWSHRFSAPWSFLQEEFPKKELNILYLFTEVAFH